MRRSAVSNQPSAISNLPVAESRKLKAEEQCEPSVRPASRRDTQAKRAIRWAHTVICVCVVLMVARSASAGERYALVVTGASGGLPYAQKYLKWRTAFVHTLRDTFRYPEDHLLVLAEDEGEAVRKATSDNVRRALTVLRRRASKDDIVLVLLIGHGSGGEGDEAKFNLVGPDLSAAEWADLLRPIAARVVFVDTSSASFPFLQKVAGRDRIVLTSTDSAAQQFETVFPEFFVKAFEDDEADLDKNGKVSIWEAFSYASRGVKKWFEERGQLSTEHPLLDDSGNGVGREANVPGADGSLAQVTYLQPDAAIAESGDRELDGLLRRRAELQSQIEQLRARKLTLGPSDYQTELERLLLELARVDREIRAKP